MKFIPHKYQAYAADFIINNPVSALFLDMGLGKTAITLTAINELCRNSFLVRKVLVIAPLRVARNTWPTEIEKWDHLKGLTYSVAIGTEAERKAALTKPASVYIINRENVSWLIENSDIPFDFDMVVIDELSSFKNHKTKRFKSLLKVRPTIQRMVGLTGTPAPNGLMDLWAQFKILDLGKRLGRYISHYRDKYFTPDKRNGMVIFSYRPQATAERDIYKQISDITISMKAEDYLDMPECIYNKVMVSLDTFDTEIYEELKKKYVTEVDYVEIDASNAAVLSGKLAQLANGCIYTDDKTTIHFHDKKLDALEDLIEAANGKPLLVAYWFNHDLENIKKRFDVREIKSNKDIEDWNNGKIPVAVIHPASAGHGLNLQAGGSTLVWYGVTWSLELYQQTNARLYRQGQKSGTVVIHHILTYDTIDEDIMTALINKNLTQSALIDAVKANLEDK